MILAGDIGGTKTLLGLFAPETPRPRAVAVQSFSTVAYHDLAAIIREFLADRLAADRTIDSMCFGVAGPITDATATLTNVGWPIDGRAIAAAFGLARVDLLNDLEAMA